MSLIIGLRPEIISVGSCRVISVPPAMACIVYNTQVVLLFGMLQLEFVQVVTGVCMRHCITRNDFVRHLKFILFKNVFQTLKLSTKPLRSKH